MTLIAEQPHWSGWAHAFVRTLYCLAIFCLWLSSTCLNLDSRPLNCTSILCTYCRSFWVLWSRFWMDWVIFWTWERTREHLRRRIGRVLGEQNFERHSVSCVFCQKVFVRISFKGYFFQELSQLFGPGIPWTHGLLRSHNSAHTPALAVLSWAVHLPRVLWVSRQHLGKGQNQEEKTKGQWLTGMCFMGNSFVTVSFFLPLQSLGRLITWTPHKGQSDRVSGQLMETVMSV